MNKILLVIDVQNDLCSPEGAFGRVGENIGSVDDVIPQIELSIQQARNKGYKIVFVKSVQEFNELPDNIKERMVKNGREDYLKPDTWGSDFYKIRPSEGDIVFTKDRYDIFYNSEFEQYLQSEKIEEIILCGFFMDMCIDSVIRTAYQKGYSTALIEKATMPLHYSKDDVLDFIIKYYNSRIIKECEDV